MESKAQINKFKDFFHLAKHGFLPLSFLGKGKDGTVYKCQNFSGVYIVKILSPYAKIFIDRSKSVSLLPRKDSASPSFEVRNNELLFYPYTQLKEAHIRNLKDVSALLKYLADFEISLLQNNYVLWDFGSSHKNYLIDESDTFHWIDFGGNGFLPLIDDQCLPNSFKKKNLFSASNDFLKLQLALHLAKFALGEKGTETYASEIQLGNDKNEEIFYKLKNIFLKTNLYNFYGYLENANLLTTDGWLQIKELANNFEDLPIEKEDINSVKVTDENVQVRGYQNFDITNETVIVQDLGHAWANSQKKFSTISTILKERQHLYSSFLDIGSNLGMYVFYAGIQLKKKSYGCDYNEKYIQISCEVNEKINGDCIFFKSHFSEIQGNYDVVQALGIIHHLYSKSENFKDLSAIISTIAKMTNKFAIIEFPTENDKKAIKWVSYNGGDIASYNKEAFEKSCMRYFKIVKIIGWSSSERPIYILEK